MSHEEFLTKALAGETGPWTEHLSSCETCREELEGLRRLEEDLVEAAPAAPQNEIWEARIAALARPIPGRSGGHPKASARWSSLAASFLLCAALAAGLRLLPAREGESRPQSVPPISSMAALGWDLSMENATLALLQEAEAVAEEALEDEDGSGDGLEASLFGGENG